MPRVDDLLDGLGGAHFISTLDLCKGYWQVPVAENSCQKTAFMTPLGKYQFRVMPFGLVGAPAVFQRMMNTLLADIMSFSGAYIDDVAIFSDSWEDHLIHLRTVFQKLREAKLTAKPRKCQFGMFQCTYLGHVVGQGKVKPEEAKISAIQSFLQPKTKKDVRSFLGLAGYYRRFIPDFATVASPLTDLTKKDAPDKVSWTSSHQQAFDQLKSSLTSESVLVSPDFHRPFILQTDASNIGVGAVLSQTDEEGNDKPVAYFSRKLLPRETRYSTTEKECLAVVDGIRHFSIYLTGTHFTVYTDHKCLQYLDKMKDVNGRLTRWSLLLQPYDFTVIHRAGTSNTNADGLSRQVWDSSSAASLQEKERGV